jgi:hypothetical protein
MVVPPSFFNITIHDHGRQAQSVADYSTVPYYPIYNGESTLELASEDHDQLFNATARANYDRFWDRPTGGMMPVPTIMMETDQPAIRS